MSDLENQTFKDKVWGFVRGLHFDGVNPARVRHDFQYLREAGWNNLLIGLTEKPVFAYAGDFYGSNNKNYFDFLLGKLNSLDCSLYE